MPVPISSLRLVRTHACSRALAHGRARGCALACNGRGERGADLRVWHAGDAEGGVQLGQTSASEFRAEAGSAVGLASITAPDVSSALDTIIARDPAARVLICGSLYLAGTVLRDNG